MIAGKVMMDRNAPEGVLDTPQQGYDDSRALIAKWHGTGRQHYAITPRFAITSTPEQMAMTGQLVREHPDCHIQTHLSENRDEIAFTLSLYPKARDYLDIYETCGLLGDKILLGHSIHLEEREIARMAETGSHPVFCPTSNLFLGSGLFDADGLRTAGIVSGIAFVFSLSISMFVIPSLLIGDRFQTLATLTGRSFLLMRDEALGSTTAVVLLALSVAIVVGSSALARRIGRPA